MLLGKRLKQLREEKEKTQTEIAQLLQITAQAYSNYERDLRIPDAAMLQKLGDYFNVTIDYLLGRSNIRKPISNPYNLTEQELELFEKIKCDPEISILFHDLKNADNAEIKELLHSWDFIKEQFKRMREKSNEK